VEGNDLGAEEVLAGSEVGDGDAVLALVGNQSVNRPLSSGGRVSILSELDPDFASTVGLCGRNVSEDGALVGLMSC
jgi:hypothetical protein